MLKNKIREWFRRYSIALLLAYIVSIAIANFAKVSTGNIIVSAFLATWADNIAFYGYIALKDLKRKKVKNLQSAASELAKLVRNMVFEFGPAEYLDSFIIRPFLLSVFPLAISNYSIAILLGNLVAEITYFIPTIISYETRKKVFRD